MHSSLSISANVLVSGRCSIERLQAVFGIRPPHWQAVLEPELDKLARELSR